MAMFSNSAGTYENACNLIKALEAQGIRSNITSGGVSIKCTPDQINLAKTICEQYSATFEGGYTADEQDRLIKSVDGTEHLRQVTDDAISLIKEWK